MAPGISQGQAVTAPAPQEGQQAVGQTVTAEPEEDKQGYRCVRESFAAAQRKVAGIHCQLWEQIPACPCNLGIHLLVLSKPLPAGTKFMLTLLLSLKDLSLIHI